MRIYIIFISDVSMEIINNDGRYAQAVLDICVTPSSGAEDWRRRRTKNIGGGKNANVWKR